MRARRVKVIFETGEINGIGAVTIASELVLHPDGTITGAGILLAGSGELAFAATGEHREELVKARSGPNEESIDVH